MSNTDNTRPVRIQLSDDTVRFGGKNGGKGRVKHVRKDLNKRFRLHGRKVLRGGAIEPESFDIPPVMTGAHCAVELAESTMYMVRADAESTSQSNLLLDQRYDDSMRDFKRAQSLLGKSAKRTRAGVSRPAPAL